MYWFKTTLNIIFNRDRSEKNVRNTIFYFSRSALLLILFQFGSIELEELFFFFNFNNEKENEEKRNENKNEKKKKIVCNKHQFRFA